MFFERMIYLDSFAGFLGHQKEDDFIVDTCCIGGDMETTSTIPISVEKHFFVHG
jgi:hypothetical protein